MTLSAINLASAKTISDKLKITSIVNSRRKESRTEVKLTMDKLRGKPLAEDEIQETLDHSLYFTDRKGRVRINKSKEED